MKTINRVLKFVVWIITLLNFYSALSQKFEIVGTVTDTQNRPISAAIIRITTKSQDSTTIAFTTTKKDGKYSIFANKSLDSSLLIVQHLSYHRQVIGLKSTTISSVQYDFILEEKNTYLKEVIVRQAPPIKISKDTTTYKVKEFIDGSEKNVEDVLKKLPGVEVKENGDVTYKGKKIDKITIEGEEFFSKNYKLISKNMPSFALDKVEAIENYNDNSLLNGITKSDKTILNLGLKEDLKTVTFGNIQTGIGVTKRYELNNTLFSVLPKIKLGQIINANNLGVDVIGETEYSLQTKNMAETTDMEVSPARFKTNENISNPNISPFRYISNNSKLLAINLSKKISEVIKAKFWSYGYMDKTNQNVTNLSSFLLPDSTLQIVDKYDLQRTPKSLKSYLEVEYAPKQNFSLKFQSLGLLSSPQSSVLNENETFGIKQYANTQYRENNFSWFNSLEFTKKLSEKKALLGYLTYQSLSSENNYDVFSRLFSSLNNYDKSVEGLEQNIKLQEKELIAKVKYVERRKNLFINFSIDFKHLYNNLDSKLNLIGLNNEILSLSSLYGNTGSYQKKSISADLGVVWEIKKWSFITGSSYHVGNISTGFLKATESSNNNFNFLNQIIGIKFTPKDGQTLQLVQSQIHTLPNLSDLNQGYWLTNYRNFQRGTTIFNQSKSNVTMLSYNLMDMMKQLSFVNRFSFAKTYSPYITNTTISKNLFYVTKLPLNGNNEYVSLNSQIDKYFHFVRTRLRAGVDLYQSYGYYQNEGNLRQNKLKGITLNGLMSTGFDFPLNIEIGVANKKNVFLTSGNSLVTQKFTVNSLFSTIRINAKSKIIGNIKFELNQFDFNSSRSVNSFTDLWISYKPDKSLFSWEVVGRNILNTKTFTNATFSNFFSSNSTFNLVPRIIEFKCEYQFGNKNSSN